MVSSNIHFGTRCSSIAWLFVLLFSVAASVLQASECEQRYREKILPLLKTYCYDCHGGGAAEGKLALDRFGSDRELLENRDLWWKVLKNLRARIMPPSGETRPTNLEVDRISQWIKFDVFGIRAEDPDPGRAVARRLNRQEYGNTIRDLMGIEFDAAIQFPPDDTGHGFDTVGEALSFSPLLMEKYLSAAQAIVDEAVPKETWITPRQDLAGQDFQDASKKIRGDDLSGKTAASVARVIQIDEAGEYAIEVTVRSRGSFDFDPARYRVIFRVDGHERTRHEHGWDERKITTFRLSEKWEAGEHRLGFDIEPLPLANAKEDVAAYAESRDPTFVKLEIQSVRVEGPVGTGRKVHPVGYSRFFPRESPPDSVEERRVYAAELLERFAKRAFRREVDSVTVDRLVTLAEQVYRQPGKTFEAGIAQAMQAVLASPRFLFRLESVGDTPGNVPFVPIDELSLATRLSYFLWSTMPDDELFRLAEAGELRAQLRQQIDRMLVDERTAEFLRNFTGQWLRTRDVTQVSVDPIAVLGHQEEFEKLLEMYRARRARRSDRELTAEDQEIRNRFRALRAISDRFNDDLKQAMRRETEMCVEYIVRENRSLLELLDSDYTFANEKLAELYGIPDVKGNEMRRVELPEGSPRGGILGHASMLLITSNPTRTSPVKRGLFLLDNVLGTPAPPPPEAVPELEESAKKFAGREPTLREVLASHRESAICAGCHARMDPLGIALENFNALGMWRDQEKDQPIDASGQLITGEKFRDVRELKKILKEQHATDFYRCITQKMLTYALGRGLEYTDEHSVDLIVERLEKNGGRFSDLLHGVAESAPFQKRRSPTWASLPRANTTEVPGDQP